MGSDDGITKSAMLLLTLGENEAAEVLKHLGPREVQKLGAAMASLKSVPRDQVEAVVNDFYEETQHGSPVTADEEYIRGMLTKALGDDRAANLISRILQGGDTAGIESLKWMDAATVADLIKNEHPQIIATILVHLEYDHSGEILKHFTERLRNDVLLRIATLDGVQPTALQELNEALTRILSGTSNVKKTSMGGIRAAAEILNFVGTAHETAIIDNVREYDPDLAQKIIDEMFVFENLIDIDDRGIQLLLREVQSESLILALKGANDAMREKVFKNMSQRAAEMLREDLESKGPVRLSEVEREQKEILKVARRLADEGQIQLGGKGDDEFV
ncbi:MAG: flagellar motor switch protein FliG [Rhodocyclaceae bacterium]|nr:flagellar motor switch protein FliG [Rhodocyclaceae bacterium]MBX3678357.1 flagellar motor switch protein FliG [Rhodocyclaceae bacterium]MCB1892104.1 flagellar motor switch protein FliG [Rhodocyclaceae bacterium]MCP5297424.1 flagellar motor switch protein FliG [Zoogloeaceae bacterium]MCW5596443.1 flagellar motor switch protein FliG [Rhodocyclaceae bacterium]